MKRTLVSLTTTLREHADGKLSGGYAGIKGGRSLMLRPTINPSTCDGTNDNPVGCINFLDCSQSTNSEPATCTNQQICFQ